jgi:RNA polymerase sigma-70 factor (ECF subfamily)
MESSKPAHAACGWQAEKSTVSPGDGGLLEALRARRREACETFVDSHYAGVFRFFVWLTGGTEAAADLTQETFACFWESLETLGGERAPDLKAWLYGIARNRWRKRCRDRHPGAADLQEAAAVPDAAPGPEALAVRGMEAAAVIRAVADLPAEYREALALRVFEELSYGQIAAALGISEGLARWRVHRARSWLCAALQPECAPSEGK